MSDHCLLLRKDLRQPLTPVPWPQGIALSALTPALLPRVHALLEQGYGAGLGDLQPLERWQHDLLHDAEYDPQLCFVSLLDGQVVGVARSRKCRSLSSCWMCCMTPICRCLCARPGPQHPGFARR